MAEQFAERVLRIAQPNRHFTLLRGPRGQFLASPDGSRLELTDVASDDAIWDASDNGFRHVVSDLELGGKPLRGQWQLSRHGAPLTIDTDNDVYHADHGPAELPSVCLERLRADGWVCLTAIVPPDQIEALEEVACTGAWSEREYDRRNVPLTQHPAVARVAAEPVSLWLIRQYMQTNEIRFSHPPSINVLTRDDGECDVQGWHSDFPYLWGFRGRAGGGGIPTHATGNLVLGVQRNICITEFTKTGGATAFKLGTHTRNEGPPEEWGLGGDYGQPGHRAANGLPYNGPDADIIEAPAGSIIIYDARTWHRAGVNRTDVKRAAMLQAITPPFVMPFIDNAMSYKAFLGSNLPAELTDRERAELTALMVHKVIGPAGQHAIGIDQELTEASAGNS